MTELILGDCLEKMRQIKSESIDSLVTDPPAGIGFMGKSWDSNKGGRDHWIKWMSDVMRECHRVLKPGAHGLVWSLPRTSHWTATACEDAGFEIRDVITHLQGQGFPKSLNINKALEKNGKICICEKQAQFQKTTNMHGMQSSFQSDNKSSSSSVKNMQLQMQRCNAALESGVCCSPSEDCTQHEGTPSCREIRSGKPSLEGRGDFQTKQGELYRSEVCEMSEGISANGTQGRLHHGTSIGYGDAYGTIVNQDRSGTPQGSQYSKQSDIEPGMVPGQPSAQTCGRCGKAIVAEGLGTALKPAAEFWHLIRKPISEKTVAENVLKWGTGGINVDGCRIGTEKRHPGNYIDKKENKNETKWGHKSSDRSEFNSNQGRFPSNLVLSHTEFCTDEICDITCAIEMLDRQSGILKSGDILPHHITKESENKAMSGKNYLRTGKMKLGDSGGASRFFYCAKTSTSDRNAGLEGMKNTHPTLKSQKLMRYFCRLVTPQKGIILDPFMGSGSTGLAAKSEGFKFIGIEQNEEYFEIAKKRIK